MELPETRYAKSGNLNIAYQVSGSGPFDLVWVQGYVNNVELHWELPGAAQFITRLSPFCRLIRFDRRGTGASDRTVDPGTTLEQRMDDVRAVMDAAGSQRAALLGVSEGGPMSISSPPANRSGRARWCSTARSRRATCAKPCLRNS